MMKTSRLRNLSASSQPQSLNQIQQSSPPALNQPSSTLPRESSTSQLEEMDTGEVLPEETHSQDPSCQRARNEMNGNNLENCRNTSVNLIEHPVKHQENLVEITETKELEQLVTEEDLKISHESSAMNSSHHQHLKDQKQMESTAVKVSADQGSQISSNQIKAGGKEVGNGYMTPSREQAALNQKIATPTATKAATEVETAILGTAQNPKASEFQKLMQKTQSQTLTPQSSSNRSQTHTKTPNRETLQVGTHQNRQSAVNLVGDLLNKIGVLENKLSSCRRFIRESPWRDNHKNKRGKKYQTNQQQNVNEKENLNINNNQSNNNTPSTSRNRNKHSKSTVI